MKNDDVQNTKMYGVQFLSGALLFGFTKLVLSIIYAHNLMVLLLMDNTIELFKMHT